MHGCKEQETCHLRSERCPKFLTHNTFKLLTKSPSTVIRGNSHSDPDPRTLKLWEWRAREAAYPVCLPATLRILDPANLFCNMQCTTVCITAPVLRVVARYPLGSPDGVPQREARPLPKTKPQESVSRRSESR